MEAGIDLHLLKPVEPAVLVGVLWRFSRVLAPTIPADRLGPWPAAPRAVLLPRASHPGVHSSWVISTGDSHP